MKYTIPLWLLLAVAATLAQIAPPAAGADAGSADHSSRTIYTCGMHPQIVQDAPGSCPICGMDLTSKALTGGAVAAGADPPRADRRIKHWVAPMDPSFISDSPGKSPMGMDLVPVYEDQGSGSGVSIDPTVVQNMGVRVRPAQRATIFRQVRTIGTVEVAEDRLSVVNLRYSGWVERIHVDQTGVSVEKGQTLFDIYSPELVSAQEEYLLALRGATPDSPLARSSRARLEFWDLPPATIERIAGRSRAQRTIAVRAPRSGHVLHKSIVQGARAQAGADLYQIADLSTVWVNAEVYEFDAPWIRVGQRATMELSFAPGETYQGSVAYIYPTLNRQSRTLTVRLEFANPDLALKPGMFATVRIETRGKENALVVPTESILHSGNRQLVFVAVELGRYEMREIVPGLAGEGDLTEVLEGLEPGERVVTSGQFLLDSESQLNEAVQKLLAARLHAGRARPAPGRADTLPVAADPTSYWTCGMHPQVVEEGPGSCPICGMDLIERTQATP